METEMWDERWPSFEPHEVLSPDGLTAYLSHGIILISPVIMDEVQRLRDNIKKPIIINFMGARRRGWRSHRENEAVGGARFSQHMFGLAVDMSCPSLSIDEFYKECENHSFTGLGVSKAKNFVHADMRNYWDPDFKRVYIKY